MAGKQIENIIGSILNEAKTPDKMKISGVDAVLITSDGDIKQLEKDLKSAGIKALKKGNDGHADGYYIAKSDGPKFLKYVKKVAGSSAADEYASLFNEKALTESSIEDWKFEDEDDAFELDNALSDITMSAQFELDGRDPDSPSGEKILKKIKEKASKELTSNYKGAKLKTGKVVKSIVVRGIYGDYDNLNIDIDILS